MLISSTVPVFAYNAKGYKSYGNDYGIVSGATVKNDNLKYTDTSVQEKAAVPTVPDVKNAPLTGATPVLPASRDNNLSSVMSGYEWNLLKSFAALIITSDDAMDYDRDSVFVLQNGRIREKEYRGIDTYTVTNAVFVPYRNQRLIFADKVNGMFSYEDDEGIFEADLSAVFPNIDNTVHTFKLKANNTRRPGMGAVIELDGKRYSMSADSLYSMMFSGYEVVREYMWR